MAAEDGTGPGGVRADAVRVSGLRFRYAGSEPWVVDVRELVVRAGERVLVTAPSGAGKSTLLHLLAGVLDPTEGSIAIDGTDLSSVRGAKRDALRGQRIGMVFQTFHLLPGFTAGENVALALSFGIGEQGTGAQRSRVSELLGRLGVGELAERPVDELSVGQQQRVAVARALACRPAVVLADEPTASLDPENADRATELMLEACAADRAALICVSHDPAMRERFERAGGGCLDDVFSVETAGVKS
ncbi:MAG: ABC transporter ATP-binding protein [Planctomycetota bacterium]